MLGTDPNTGEEVVDTVTAQLIHESKTYDTLIINGTLTVTPEHEVRIIRNGYTFWTSAAYVVVGDSLIGEDGSPVPVTSTAKGPSLPVVYNLTTYPSHTYFAGGVVVHNAKSLQQNL